MYNGHNKDSENKIYFQIERIESKTNSETFDAKLELENLVQNGQTDVDGEQFGYESSKSINEKTTSSIKRRPTVRPKFLPGQ